MNKETSVQHFISFLAFTYFSWIFFIPSFVQHANEKREVCVFRYFLSLTGRQVQIWH